MAVECVASCSHSLSIIKLAPVSHYSNQPGGLAVLSTHTFPTGLYLTSAYSQEQALKLRFNLGILYPKIMHELSVPRLDKLRNSWRSILGPLHSDCFYLSVWPVSLIQTSSNFVTSNGSPLSQSEL